ncbi:uncharacterized protein LOC122083940 [Macadamia integrifolia]|uniref:uncharacterized protein LOC122083940 n=1 Tax=Macadamia integrifolia TaxID=60698 RepID=UPI001C4F6B44|nr:uncharacterized protein LOC122083940 [Macadamia integrifolia]
MGTCPPIGVLLFDPPGCSKTLMVSDRRSKSRLDFGLWLPIAKGGEMTSSVRASGVSLIGGNLYLSIPNGTVVPVASDSFSFGPEYGVNEWWMPEDEEHSQDCACDFCAYMVP